jgi:CrcB protein
MSEMRNLLIVGLGGFLGALLRYVVGGLVQNTFQMSTIPLGTFTVNIVGCFALGFCGGWGENIEAFSPETRLFLMIGLFGAFTTYSTFGYETMALMRDGQFLYAFLNVALHILLGFGAVWIGYGASSIL